MKKMIFALIASTALVSCKKEVITPSSTPTTTETTTETLSAARPSGENLRIYYDDGGPTEGVNYGCKGTGGRCLDDIIVTLPHRLGSINAVFGAIHSNNEVAIQQVFEKYKNVLINHMDEGDVDGVIRGDLKARARGTNPSETRYMILSDASTDTEVIVYPFAK